MGRRELEGVYGRALYRVDASSPFVLRVGQFSDALKALFELKNCRSAAFLTAFNPQSVKTTDTLNTHAQNQLKFKLSNAGLLWIPGMGLDADPRSSWPAEPSVLALNITLDQATVIAKEFNQLAILWCPASAIPELHMLD